MTMTVPSSAGPCVVRDARDGKFYSAILEQYDGSFYWVRAFNASGNPFELHVDVGNIWTVATRPAEPLKWYEPGVGGYSGAHTVTKVNLTTLPPGVSEGD